jgi:hypothetical protein
MSSHIVVRVRPPASSLEQDTTKDANSAHNALSAGDLQAAQVYRVAGPEAQSSEKSAMTVASSNEATWNEGSLFDVMA